MYSAQRMNDRRGETHPHQNIIHRFTPYHATVKMELRVDLFMDRDAPLPRQVLLDSLQTVRDAGFRLRFDSLREGDEYWAAWGADHKLRLRDALRRFTAAPDSFLAIQCSRLGQPDCGCLIHVAVNSSPEDAPFTRIHFGLDTSFRDRPGEFEAICVVWAEFVAERLPIVFGRGLRFYEGPLLEWPVEELTAAEIATLAPPPIKELNVYGPAYVETLGRGRLLQSPVGRAVELSNGAIALSFVGETNVDTVGRLARDLGIPGPRYHWPLELDLYVARDVLTTSRVETILELLQADGLWFERSDASFGDVWDEVGNTYVAQSLEEAIARFETSSVWAVRLWMNSYPGDEESPRQVSVLVDRSPSMEPFALVRVTTEIYYFIDHEPLTTLVQQWLVSLCELLHPWYGAVGGRERVLRGRPNVQIDKLLGRVIPGMDWIVVVGQPLAERYGREFLLKTPGLEIRETADGSILLTAGTYWESVGRGFDAYRYLKQREPKEPPAYSTLKVEAFVQPDGVTPSRIASLVDSLAQLGFTPTRHNQDLVRYWDDTQLDRVAGSLPSAIDQLHEATSWTLELWKEPADEVSAAWPLELMVERGPRAQPFCLVTIELPVANQHDLEHAATLRLIAELICEKLQPFYGWAGRPEGISLRWRMLTGATVASVENVTMEWLNLFSPAFQDQFGHDRLAQLSFEQRVALPDGSLLALLCEGPTHQVDLRQTTLRQWLAQPSWQALKPDQRT
jgi:hypothetical protein